MEKKIRKRCVGSDVCIGAVCLSDSAGKTNLTKKRNSGSMPAQHLMAKYTRACHIHAWKMTGANNSNLPKGETYENNAYTRYLREYFNIQIRMYLRKRMISIMSVWPLQCLLVIFQI